MVVRAELNKIRGIETIYQALLLRQTLIARQNQFQCKMSVLREQDKEDIEIIEETIHGQVNTNKVILLFLKFALDVDLASLCTNYFDDLQALYKSRGVNLHQPLLQFYDIVAESQGAQDLFQRSQGSFNISQLLLILDSMKFDDHRTALFVLQYFVQDVELVAKQALVTQQFKALFQNLIGMANYKVLEYIHKIENIDTSKPDCGHRIGSYLI
jgi:hypothetical protein